MLQGSTVIPHTESIARPNDSLKVVSDVGIVDTSLKYSKLSGFYILTIHPN